MPREEQDLAVSILDLFKEEDAPTIDKIAALTTVLSLLVGTEVTSEENRIKSLETISNALDGFSRRIFLRRAASCQD